MHQSKIDHALAGPSSLPLTPILVVSKATNRRRLSRLSEARNAAAAAACWLSWNSIQPPASLGALGTSAWDVVDGERGSRLKTSNRTLLAGDLECWSVEDSFFNYTVRPSEGLHRYGTAACPASKVRRRRGTDGRKKIKKIG